MHCNYPIMFIKKKKQASKPQSHVASLCKHHRAHDCLRKWEFLLKRRVMCKCSILSGPDDSRSPPCLGLQFVSLPETRKRETEGKKNPPSSREQWTWSMKKFTLSPATVNLMNLSERKWNLKFHSGFELWDIPLIFLLCVFILLPDEKFNLAKRKKKDMIKCIQPRRRKLTEMSCEISSCVDSNRKLCLLNWTSDRIRCLTGPAPCGNDDYQCMLRETWSQIKESRKVIINYCWHSIIKAYEVDNGTVWHDRWEFNSFHDTSSSTTAWHVSCWDSSTQANDMSWHT